MLKRLLWGGFLGVLMLTDGSRTVDNAHFNHNEFTGAELFPGQVLIRELIWQTDDEIVATIETSNGLHQVQIDCQSGLLPHQLDSIVSGTDRQLQIVQDVCRGKLG